MCWTSTCEASRLAVEVDGASHGLGDRPVRDERRDAWLAKHGIATLRLSAGPGSSRFLCTDAPGRFAHLGQIFLGEPIDPGSVTLVDL